MKSVLDFFLPRLCIICRNPLRPDADIICGECKKGIAVAPDSKIEDEFSRKFRNDKLIADFAALYIFVKDHHLQTIIHELKYNKKFRIGIFLGKEIAAMLSDKIIEWEADIILPVPLHPLKKAERGYNQSYYIAKGISKLLEIPVKSNLIRRVKYTNTQTELSAKERKENIRGAFRITNPIKVKGKRIIIVDDVITTGSTISECAELLISGGSGGVFALSAAIAN